MCGIFGIAFRDSEGISLAAGRAVFERLALLSESRGKEAAGVAFDIGGRVVVHKQPRPISEMLVSSEYKEFWRSAVSGIQSRTPVAFIGHARLVTNGSQLVEGNNQPVATEHCIGVHNGIIVNEARLWRERSNLHREFEVDTEVLVKLVDAAVASGADIQSALESTLALLEGAITVALLIPSRQALVLATNTGSLYYAHSDSRQCAVFGSENFLLQTLKASPDASSFFAATEITQLAPFSAAVIDLQRFSCKVFPIRTARPIGVTVHSRIDRSGHPLEIEYRRQLTKRRELRRCSRCILPETMPFITFDANGVCNFCLDHRRVPLKGVLALETLIEPYRNQTASDCLVPLSGGRDSCYALHYIKSALKMTPLAYTYDWGMVTDLARRNMARLCGALGVEHILISADIGRKRRNIRKNILAWLKRPELGMVTLFTAGDKHFYYYANQLLARERITLAFFAENPRLEQTKFKSAFCGVDERQRRLFHLSVLEKLSLASYFTRNIIANPAYLNLSIPDTIASFVSAYVLTHRYHYLFEYIPWDETTIIQTLRNEYDWEAADDTDSTWRIGDGTASFYNYIYFMLAGFSEHDTFRSNQIREGMLEREEALRLAAIDNLPRWSSLEWYAETIDFDLLSAVKRIHESVPPSILAGR